MKSLTLALALSVLVPMALVAHPPDAGTVETVIHFDPQVLETPENIVIDKSGTMYISLALTGEIRRIAPDGTQSTLITLPIGAPLTFCGPFFNAVTGITLDSHDGSLYASVAACDPAFRGVWRISPNGQGEVIANLPLTGIPNGIDLDDDQLYVADSFLGVIWRVPAAGGQAEVWLDDPLLKLPPGAPTGFPGPNGLKLFRGEVYVSNSAAGTLLAIPIRHDGSAGTPRIHAHLPAPSGCDDFAFDVHGAIYCTTDPFLTLVKVNPDGTTQILLTDADGLDGPTAAAFGRKGQDRFNLYITNGAFPFFSTTHQPSLMRLHLDVPGASPDK